MIRWIATGVYFALLTWVLVTPDPFAIPRAILRAGGASPKPIGLLEALNDKAVHGTAFGILVVLLFWASRGRGPLYILLFAIAYGGLTEVIQAFVPPRTADWLDWAADSAGSLCGLALAALATRMISGSRRVEAEKRMG